MLSASLCFHTQDLILLPLRKMETLQVLWVGVNACLYSLQSPGVYVLQTVFNLCACMYFLCSSSFSNPLEFAALSAMTMTSFIPTGMLPGKRFILKKCHFPMKKLFY